MTDDIPVQMNNTLEMSTGTSMLSIKKIDNVKKQLEFWNVPDLLATCRSEGGEGGLGHGGVGGSTDCGWTWGGLAEPRLTSSVIFIQW